MVICARRTVLLPRIIIRLVVIESVTLSLVRDTETNEADEIDRSIEQSVVALCSE